MCLIQLLMGLLILLDKQDDRKAFSPCVEHSMIMQAPGRLCCALSVVWKEVIVLGFFFFSKHCQYLLCQGSYSALQKLQLCCQWKNRLEEEIIKNMWASTSDTTMRFQCCRQQAIRQRCRVACLSFQCSALAEDPFARLRESRSPVETLKRLVPKRRHCWCRGGLSFSLQPCSML